MPRNPPIDSRPDARRLFGMLRALVLSCLGASLAAFVLAELGLRALGLPHGSERSFRGAYDVDGAFPGPFRAGAQISIFWPPEIPYTAHFNSLGCRGREPTVRSTPPILAVGDSISFGMGVEDEQTWPARLEQMLADAGTPRTVVNLSCGGWVIDDQLDYLEKMLPVAKPDLVILQLSPDAQPAPPEGGLTSHQRSMVRERRQRSTSRRLYESLALHEVRILLREWRKRFNDEGRGEFPPQFHRIILDPEEASVPRAHFEQQLLALRETVEASGARLLLVPYPAFHGEGDEVIFEEAWTASLAERLQLPAVALWAAFERHEPTRTELVLWPFDFHLSRVGHEVLARSVAERLRETGWLAPRDAAREGPGR